jgi:hypothetical protein
MYLPAAPQPPRSPSPRARHLVFRFQTVEVIFLVVGSVLFLAGSLVAALLCRDLPADLMLSLGSTTTVEGRVLSERIDPYNRVNLVHPTIFAFSYAVDGTQYQGESRTTKVDLIAKLRHTRRAIITVSRAHPAWARIEGAYAGAYGPLAAVMLIVPGLGLSFLIVVLRRRHSRVSIFTLGEATPGTLVFKGINPRIRINGRHPEMLRWKFSVAGAPHEGSISSMDPQDFAGLAVQGQVIVLYDPSNPANNVPYLD